MTNTEIIVILEKMLVRNNVRKNLNPGDVKDICDIIKSLK